MNHYYPKYSKKDNYQTRYYKNKGNYCERRNRFQSNNNYWNYRYNKINYDYNNNNQENFFDDNDKETNDSSFSKSNNSNSRKNSNCKNNNENNDINNNKDKDFEKVNQNNVFVPKIKLSENDMKSAYFVPKSYKGNKSIIKNQTDNQVSQKKDENIVILEINIKISEDKTIFFQLRKYDDMFLEIKKICEENKIEEELSQNLPRIIIKALNSIYGIMNLKLNEEEIEMIKELMGKYL